VDNQKPRRLYKFLSNHDHIKDLLLNKRLYFACPSSFNDPFDSHPPIILPKIDSAEESVWKKYFYVVHRLVDKLNEEDASGKAELYWNNRLHQKPEFLRNFQEILDEIGNSCRICCFAQDPRDPVFWAHYANSHQGLALGFNPKFLRDPMTKEYRGRAVEYRSQPIRLEEYVERFADSSEQGKRELAWLLHSTKSHYWSHESEVRHFTVAETEHLAFPESALTKIILGARCSDELYDLVIRALENWQTKPPIFKVSIEKSRGRLWIECCRPMS
jgi:hypothetical protein